MNALKVTAVSSLVLVTALGSLAQADDRYYDDGARDRYGDRYQGENYRSETAEVVGSRPIYSDVRINEPRQECYQQEVHYDDRRYDNSGSFLGTILGGVVGGVVGHQFGRGGGRAAATAIGAVVGAGAGNAIGGQNDRVYGGDRVAYQDQCSTVNRVHYEQRISGYDVTYRFHGQLYHTQMAQPPGERIPVNVSVTPAGY